MKSMTWSRAPPWKWSASAMPESTASTQSAHSAPFAWILNTLMNAGRCHVYSRSWRRETGKTDAHGLYRQAASLGRRTDPESATPLQTHPPAFHGPRSDSPTTCGCYHLPRYTADPATHMVRVPHHLGLQRKLRCLSSMMPRTATRAMSSDVGGSKMASCTRYTSAWREAIDMSGWSPSGV